MIHKIQADLKTLQESTNPAAELASLLFGLKKSADFEQLRRMLMETTRPLVIECLHAEEGFLKDFMEDIQQKSEYVFVIWGPAEQEI